MPKRLIITIDGGGIRGIIPLVILRHLQLHIEKPLPELTTAWYGTSTGALIAAGLLVQRTGDFNDAIQNVLDIYEFRSSSSANSLGTSNPARALHKILDENFAHSSFDELRNLHVIACRLPDFDLTVFNQQHRATLVDALKASCAVPGLFDPVSIADQQYVDGFIRAKNPAGLAIELHNPKSDVIVLSLGTGILREVDETETQVKETHLTCEALSHKKGFHYFRFNPRLEEAADSMLDTRLKNIFGLKKDAENYLRTHTEKVKQFISLLNSQGD